MPLRRRAATRPTLASPAPSCQRVELAPGEGTTASTLGKRPPFAIAPEMKKTWETEERAGGKRRKGQEFARQRSETAMGSKPRVISLFSGSGGMDLGFVRAGFEIV